MNPVEVRGQVSVPSRGLSYLNAYNMSKETKKACVSVPSRGLSYLNKRILLVCWQRKMGFRPLTGTLLSKREKGNGMQQ